MEPRAATTAAWPSSRQSVSSVTSAKVTLRKMLCRSRRGEDPERKPLYCDQDDTGRSSSRASASLPLALSDAKSHIQIRPCDLEFGLPRGSSHSSRLRIVNDKGAHWLIEPAADMPLEELKSLLRGLEPGFQKVS